MDLKFAKKWGDRNLTIKVTNKVCGRVDIHKNISREEISWIACNSNLEVEVLELSLEKKRKPRLKEE
jgi:hypothetical protein